MHTGHKAVLNDETEWVRLENHHTAIIDRELFKKANEMHPKKRRIIAESRTNFTLERRKKQPALLICANCGHSLLKETEHLLKCSDDRTNGDPVCRSLVIRREPLEENILGLAHQYAASMLEKGKKASSKRQCEYKEINTAELQKQSRQLTSEKMKLYDDYKDGRKTSITLTAIEQLIYDSFEVSKVLVVAPLRVARNTWSDEIHKWDHLKHLRYSIVLGSAAERKRALEADADIYIINRENLQWLIEQSGVKFFWDMVVLDELSSFKNWNSKRFKAFMKVRPKVQRVIGLTGTPSSNGLMDLFAEFKCLDMGERLGRFISQYRVNYFVPDRMNGPIVYSYKLRNGAEEQIYEKISDITISMKALDHLRMPELISNSYPVYMDADEAKIYTDMEEDLFIPLKKGEITAANAATLSGKLLQMANGAVYSDEGDEIVIHDQKLDALEDMIEAANGRPVMVAYWFKHDLSRIMRRLTEKKIPFEKLDSEESIRKWNRGELPVALIHPASAGHGLNLQSGGNMLIWFGLTWSLELYQQTVARLWRQGQTAETVVVQHIITAGTIDEDVMKALANKDMTQNRLIAAVKARVTHGR